MSQEGRREVLQREGVALRGLTWGDGEAERWAEPLVGDKMRGAKASL